MNTQHTPGPWYVSGTNPPMVYARDGLDIICQCDIMREETRAHEMATARLLAAAPDLLAALEVAEKSLTFAMGAIHMSSAAHIHMGIDRDIVRAAIAKAKGEA